MKKFLLLPLLLLSPCASAGVFGVAPPGWVEMSGTNIGIDDAATTPTYYTQITTPITSAISSLGSSLSTSLALQSQKQTSSVAQAIDASTKLKIKADQDAADKAHGEKIVEAQDQILAQRAVEGNYTPAPITCTDRATAEVMQAAPVAQTYQSNKLSRMGRVNRSHAAASADQSAMTEDVHQNFYCNPETDPNKCAGTAPVQTVSVDGRQMSMPDADSRASSLFSGAGDDSHSGNMTFVPEQTVAANAYINSVISSGDAPKALSPSEAATPDGKVYQGLKIAYESRISLAESVLNDIAAERMPIPGSEVTLENMKQNAAADAASGVTYLNDRIKAIQKFSAFSNKPQISPLELTDIQVKMRSDNPDWMKFISSADAIQLQKEKTTMLSLMLRMQYETKLLNEKRAALKALAAADKTKQNLLPRLNRQLKTIAQK